ncbi:hypothetical protein DASC09_017830 [Saccharomycopsis crataegensis]|uniref:Uncharacterized protein n=1 Tax=Saccharomycopsis crataegensis TaxID=43959 RepID=A0AAV5QHY7_9ASCO|nr:hypothetical protein DASC09_017830 [Saccharomycopsis crataegensis]
MFGVHQKLYLQSQDARYLHKQVQNASKAKLDLHLPKTAANPKSKYKRRRSSRRRSAIHSDNEVQEEDKEEDVVRLKVRKLVEKYIDEAFELTKYSVVIDDKELGVKESLNKKLFRSELTKNNGKSVPASDVEIEVEPFDFGVNEKLRERYYEAEALTTAITKKRSTIPLRFKKSVNRLANRNIQQFEKFNEYIMKNHENGEAQAVMNETEQGAYADNDNKNKNNNHDNKDSLLNNEEKVTLVANKKDHENIVKEFEESLVILSELKSALPQRRNEIGKLKKLMEYIEGHKVEAKI